MAIRVRPVVETTVYAETTEGPVLYPAYGGRHRVYDLSSRDFDPNIKKNLMWSQFTAEQVGQAGSAGGTSYNGHTLYDGVKFIGSPVEAAIAYPMIDRVQKIDLNYFDAVGYAKNYWIDGNDGEYFRWADASTVLMYNYYGSAINFGYGTGLWSRFEYPPNPIICLAILRNDPPKEHLATRPLSTSVIFGYSAQSIFMLNIPYSAPPRLYVWHVDFTGGKWMPVQATKGGASALNLSGDPGWRGGAGAETKQLWIAAVGGGIAVSEDCFESVCFFPLRWTEPDTLNPYGLSPLVNGGPIGVFHNAGQWALAVPPIKMPDFSWIRGPVEGVPYDPTLAWLQTGELPWLTFRHQPVIDNQGAQIGNISGSHTLNPDDGLIKRAAGAEYEWIAQIPSTQFTSNITGSGLGTALPSIWAKQFKTCVSPALYDVIYAQPAIMRGPSGATGVAKTPVNGGFSIQRSVDEISCSGTLVLDNQLGQEKDIAESEQPRMITAMGYVVDNDGNLYPENADDRALFSGYGVVRTGGEGGKSTLELDLYGIGRQLTECKKLSDTFPLDGQPVDSAMRHAASWAGIAPAKCRFEDLGTSLNWGPWDKELYWYTDSAENLANLMEEICVYDYNAALWEDEEGYLVKGCPFCRQLRTAEDVTTHFGAGLASPGCLLKDIETSLDGSGIHYRFFTGAKYKHLAGTVSNNYTMYAEVASIDKPAPDVEGKYFNSCRIKGPVYGRNDDSETVDYTDWYSVNGVTPPDGYGYALGYKKTLERTYGWAANHRIRSLVAYWLWSAHRVRPEFRTLVVPFLPEVRRGQVFQVYGNMATQHGLAGKDYRVTAYAHQPSLSGRERATTITGRFMRMSVVEA